MESGFDVVLANPPYVRQEKIKDLKLKLKPHYPDTYSGTADLYVYFYDRALQLLKKRGSLAFITSNKWFRAAYGERLREHLVKHSTLLHLIDFGDAPVFEAIAYPTIVIARNNPPTAKHELRTLNWNPETPTSAIVEFEQIYAKQSTPMPQNVLTSDSWQFIAKSHRNLLDRIRAAGKPLGEVVKGHFHNGVKSGLTDAFIVDIETRDKLITEHESSSEQREAISVLARYIIFLSHLKIVQQTIASPDTLMLGYFEQLLNALVYELYFGDELHEAGLSPFKLVSCSQPPVLDALPTTARLTQLREYFTTIYHLDHPIRSTLHALQSRETIRIIEVLG